VNLGRVGLCIFNSKIQEGEGKEKINKREAEEG
jgi:hypothetical protein